ncbi:MAG: hypothetical protein K2K10_06880, partial [Acetatifactor sp.]|nr:hypothetical protein [Acetatifactor sp.]
MDILQDLPGEAMPQYVQQLLVDDYQQSDTFRGYIADRLATFLAMATNSFGYSNYYSYRNGYNTAYEVAVLQQGTMEGVPPMTVSEAQYYGYNYDDYYYQYYNDYDEDYAGNHSDEKSPSLTDEQLAEQRKEIAQRYHDNIK